VCGLQESTTDRRARKRKEDRRKASSQTAREKKKKGRVTRRKKGRGNRPKRKETLLILVARPPGEEAEAISIETQQGKEEKWGYWKRSYKKEENAERPSFLWGTRREGEGQGATMCELCTSPCRRLGGGPGALRGRASTAGLKKKKKEG